MSDSPAPSVLATSIAVAGALLGAFALFIPLVSWPLFVLGFVSVTDYQTLGQAGMWTAMALAVAVTLAAPVGMGVSTVALFLYRREQRRLWLPGLGLAANLVAPLTWLGAWGTVIFGVFSIMSGVKF